MGKKEKPFYIQESEKLGLSVNKQLIEGMTKVARQTQVSGELANYGMTAGLASAQVVAPLLAKELDEEDRKDQGKHVAKLINEETIVFASLLAAAMHDDVGPAMDQRKIEDDIVDATVARSAATVAYGPQTFVKALNWWQRIYPNKAPEHYLNAGMLKMAHEEGYRQQADEDAASDVLRKFLERKAREAGSGTVQ